MDDFSTVQRGTMNPTLKEGDDETGGDHLKKILGPQHGKILHIHQLRIYYMHWVKEDPFDLIIFHDGLKVICHCINKIMIFQDIKMWYTWGFFVIAFKYLINNS